MNEILHVYCGIHNSRILPVYAVSALSVTGPHKCMVNSLAHVQNRHSSQLNVIINLCTYCVNVRSLDICYRKPDTQLEWRFGMLLFSAMYMPFVIWKIYSQIISSDVSYRERGIGLANNRV